MTKKILGIILCLSLLFSICAFANEITPSVEIKVADANLDKITVSGTAPVGSGVFLTVFYPGSSEEDLKFDSYEDNKKAVAFSDAAFSKDGTYSFSVKLKDNGIGGGSFTFSVTIGEEEFDETFEFYYYEKKLDIIKRFNNPGEEKEEDILKDAAKTYSYSEEPLWTEGDEGKTLTALLNLKNNLEGKKFEEDPSSFDALLKTALLMSAINDKNSELVLDEGYIREDILAFLDSDAVYEYKNSLSNSGVEGINKDFLNKEYNLPEDASDYFKEIIAFYVISAYKDKGYGHIEAYLEKFSEIYDDAGFKLEKFDALTKSNKNKFLSAFMKEKSTNLDGMADDFNETFSTYKGKTESSGSSSGGSSGGGSSYGGGSSIGGGKVTSDTTGNQGLVDPSVYAPVFSDISTQHWSYNAVGALAKENIISGYEDNTFKPEKAVTRAEFTKMISSIAKNDENRKIKVATVGDSITQGLIDDSGKYNTQTPYSIFLQEYLGNDYEVKNFGLSARGIYDGHEYPYKTTEEYKNSLAYEADVYVIMFGTNDAKTAYWNDIKASYKQIYADFIDIYLSLPSKPQIYIGVPGPCFEGDFYKDRPEDIMEEMRSIVREVAKEKNIKTVDLQEKFGNKKEYFLDGLHINIDAGKIISKDFADMIISDSAVNFEDVKSSDWYASYVLSAAKNKIVNGSGNLFRPNDSITREDAAVIIYRLISKDNSFYKEKTFEDDDKISEYALEAVRRLGGVYIISGMGDGNFAPKNTLTRAQAAVLIYGAMDYIKK